ncbi:hypothetical protein P73_4004 [Celeribacter indicus]|uniref:Glycoside hydrolase 123 catalytic domain-containing protein n=1 Tax=Celeribacter indicus TaxID=1208324 RepID=A0A0B5E0F1_9RHOB|nr:hypothetical protein P73_4004 [Celeribacter indicus]
MEKIFPDTKPRPLPEAFTFSTWRGGRVSLQVAILPPDVTTGAVVPHPPEGLLPGVVTTPRTGAGITAKVSSVDLVPARFLAFENHDDNYLRDDAGLWPDPLRPLGDGGATKVFVGQWQAVWIDFIVTADAPLGRQSVEIALATSTGQDLGSHTVSLDIHALDLAPLSIPVTQWMHCDCIAQYYGIEPFSGAFWTSVEAYAKAAAEIGITSLLAPVWTPVLDTAVGAQRLTCQLLGIAADAQGHYDFDFSLLRRWLGIMHDAGLQQIEIAHFFTQWGAEATPPIYVTRNGATTREFGWDVPATDPSYRKLLEQLVPALREVLDAEWGLDRVIFHISDEPTAAMAPTYRAAKNVVADLLDGCTIVDAMSAFSLFEEGIVDTPVVATNHAAPFIEAGVDNMWLYYCVGQNRDVANRFFAMPPSRNRVFGSQLFVTKAAGFLHWGFNFYNTYLSKRALDPFLEPDAGGAFPAGDPFIVYPGPDYTVWHSTRGMVFGEALEDLRLMQALEERKGREAVLDLIDPERTMSLSHYPTDPVFYLDLRNALVAALAA